MGRFGAYIIYRESDHYNANSLYPHHIIFPMNIKIRREIGAFMAEHANDKPPHITVEQLENMTTHQLAQLLANLTKVLQQMPDEPLKDLKRAEPPIQIQQLTHNVLHKTVEPEDAADLPDWLN
jgi:hypothetical protein